MMIKNLINKTISFIERHSLFFILAGFILFNLFFNFNAYVSELWHDQSLEGAVVGEVLASEWASEIIYQRIKNFENPYQPFDEYLYPIGIDTAGASIGFSFWMILFRPFLSIHQSFSMIVILNFFLANLGMYLLLRTIKIGKMISFIVALMFGYMTFIMPRIGGHPEFTTHYLLPWFYWSLWRFFQLKNYHQRIFLAALTGFLYAATLYHGIYYFLILTISAGVLAFYFMIADFKKFFSQLWNFKQYLVLAILSALLFLFPWVKGVYDSMLFSLPPQPMGWAGAIQFSSDLFGFFVPSIYNHYYGAAVIKITTKINFARGIFENFSYPGVTILLSFAYIAIALVKNKLGSIKNKLWPFLVASLFFALLTMGPFLHVLGIWTLDLNQSIKLVIPLPFAGLHYLPFLSNVRVPGRFAVGLIFFGYIVVATLLDEVLKNKSRKIIMASFLLLLGIFIIDHRYQDKDFATPRNVPSEIYQTIAEDNDDQVVVMRIPFSVRDGLMYFGSIDHILSNEGQEIHRKPVIGGYAGRLPTHAFNYYLNNPFLGYLGLLFDQNYQTNGFLIMRGVDHPKAFNLQSSQRATDFLNLKYVVSEKPTSKTQSQLIDAWEKLELLGFSQKMEDSGYLLFSRELGNEEFLEVILGEPEDELMLSLGWLDREADFRWANKSSSVMFNLKQEREMLLEFEAASFYQNQVVDIYLNKEQVGSINISTNKNTYEINLPQLKRGLNTVHFIFEQSFKPKNILVGNEDERELSAKFYRVTLREENDN